MKADKIIRWAHEYTKYAHPSFYLKYEGLPLRLNVALASEPVESTPADSCKPGPYKQKTLKLSWSFKRHF